MSKKDSLGDRMKRYESVSNIQLTPRSCVLVRVDGNAFHTFTKKLKKFTKEKTLFNADFILSMRNAAMDTASRMQGFKLAYIQSDEASFLLSDFDTINTDGWFGYNHSKIVSLSASLMTSNFIKHITKPFPILDDNFPIFDSRAFIIPNDDVSNYFLWRARDWNRNSINMYARSFFSHSQLKNKNTNDIHEMLHGINKNWTNDLGNIEKNGTFLIKNQEMRKIDIKDCIKPNFKEIDGIVNNSRVFDYL